MTKKESMKKDLMEFNGGSPFISKKKFTDFMGEKSPNSVTKYTSVVPKYGQRYYVGDLVDAIIASETWG